MKSFVVTRESKPKHIIPEGRHIAKILQIIDIGMQPRAAIYGGGESSQVLAVFEIVDDIITEGPDAGKNPFKTKPYNLTFGPKASIVKELLTKVFPKEASS